MPARRTVEPDMTRLAALCVGLTVLASCGSPKSPSSDGSGSKPDLGGGEYRTSGTVIDKGEGRPELCIGGVADSYPPQCSGIPLIDWNWSDVEGEETSGQVSWGDYEITGRYDGKSLTVLEVGPPASPPPESENPFESPCEEPPGGWEIPDPERTRESDWRLTIKAAEQATDSSGAWIDYLGKEEPTEFGKNPVMLNLAFTGDLDDHEAEARTTWGGALCVAEFERTFDRLREIQDEFGDTNEFGLEITYTDVNVMENVVQIGVVVIGPATLERIDERYGEGTVEVEAMLEPV